MDTIFTPFFFSLAMNNTTYIFPYSTIQQRIIKRLASREYDFNMVSNWGLVDLNGDPNKTLALRYGFSSIGRHSDDNFKTTGILTSRGHVMIEIYKDAVFISDISTNGTCVYSRRSIDPLFHNDREVRDGDIILINSFKFKLVKLKSIIIRDD